MRILVIEDEPQLARHITRALVRSGHDASAERDGAEGLRAALANPPDLIVLGFKSTVDGRLRGARGVEGGTLPGTGFDFDRPR